MFDTFIKPAILLSTCTVKTFSPTYFNDIKSNQRLGCTLFIQYPQYIELITCMSCCLLKVCRFWDLLLWTLIKMMKWSDYKLTIS